MDATAYIFQAYLQGVPSEVLHSLRDRYGSFRSPHPALLCRNQIVL